MTARRCCGPCEAMDDAAETLTEGGSAPDALLSALAAAGAPHAFESALAAVGLVPSDVSSGSSPSLAGHFLVEADPLVTVYLASERMFGMCQFTTAGELLQVTVPLERVRRLAALQDGLGLRVTVELEADRSTVTSTFEEDGSSRSVQVPAGYELIATDPAGVTSLRAFYLTLARVL